jgi:hypothetical protein
MKIGIMQPYFFPYLGYFSLIKQTDRFILFDTVQFIKHGWIERNRILKPNEGWQYVKVPLEKYNRNTSIMDIRINNNEDWRDKIFRQLEHYKKRSPYYYDTIKVIDEALGIKTDSMVQLNLSCLKAICNYIGIQLNVDVFSELDLTIDEVYEPDEWALNICKALGNITEYWNPEGGVDFFDRSKYIENGLDIKFLKMNLDKYSQRRQVFEPGLSIIDAMMFNTPEEIKDMLDNYIII